MCSRYRDREVPEDGSDVQPVKVSNDVVTVAAALGLEEK